MLLLGVKNIAPQTVVTGGLIDLGVVYRKYCKKNTCGVKAFDFNGTSVALQHQGIYHITATMNYTVPTAGTVIIQLLDNGEVVSGALTSETVATATTAVHTGVIDYYILVDTTRLLNQETTVARNLSLINSGVGATITSVVFNVEKVV